MKYSKPHLSFAQQTDRLIERGMLGDRDLIADRLQAVSYYRLSGYWKPFQNSDSSFRPGTRFEVVWNRYAFDRRLRLMAMDAIERIEISVRTFVAYYHSASHGPFGYITDPGSLPKLDADERRKLFEHVAGDVRRSHEDFVAEYKKTYTASPDMPIWMATEVMSFGTVMNLFFGTSNQVKKNTADAFGVPHGVFKTWLLALSAVRNICAHHCRLWNRVLGIRPFIPLAKDYPAWHVPMTIRGDRVFSILTICKHCLSCVAPQSQWGQRVDTLLAEFPDVPIRDMGFPAKWRECPIWQS